MCVVAVSLFLSCSSFAWSRCCKKVSMVVTWCSQCQRDLILQKTLLFNNEKWTRLQISPLSPEIENQRCHEICFFPKKKCTLNEGGANLACWWRPNLACQECQARASSSSVQKAPNSTGHSVSATSVTPIPIFFDKGLCSAFMVRITASAKEKR